LRHGLERFSSVILVQPGDDYSLAGVCKFLGHVHKARIEELTFIDSDDLRLARTTKDLRRVFHDSGREAGVTVRNDVVGAEACVNSRLENSHIQARDLGTPDPPDEFFGLAAEHTSGDDLNPANPSGGIVSSWRCHERFFARSWSVNGRGKRVDSL
jgi:hypothetical protein